MGEKQQLPIKLMDTILFDKNEPFKPEKWIYTDLLARIQFKDITNIDIEEVIKAFLLNIKKDTQLVDG